MSRLYIAFITVFSLLLSLGAGAQCTPDPEYTASGVYPDSATGLADAHVGSAYEEIITLVVPADTMVELIPGSGISVEFDSIVLTGVDGLPNGFTYACNPVSCGFKGGTSGCVSLIGNPVAEDEGNYPLTVYLSAYFGGTGTAYPYEVTSYHIDVLGPDNIEEFGSSFKLGQNVPNPFDRSTRIPFAVPPGKDYELKILDLLGKEVLHYSGTGSEEEQYVEVLKSDVGSGIFMYTLSFDSYQLTNRLIVR